MCFTFACMHLQALTSQENHIHLHFLATWERSSPSLSTTLDGQIKSLVKVKVIISVSLLSSMLKEVYFSDRHQTHTIGLHNHRTSRCLRSDCALELSLGNGIVEALPCLSCGQHGRPQSVRADSIVNPLPS